MSEISKDQAREELSKRTDDFEEKDMGTVINEEEKILGKFESKGKLKRYFENERKIKQQN